MRIVLFMAITTLPLHAETAEYPLSDKPPVKLFHLSHPSGISASVSNLGATLRSLSVPDRDGKFANILVGFETPDEWLDNKPFFGSTVGRYANRIAQGKFSLNGEAFTLSINNNPNHLHGGTNGFDKAIWASEVISDQAIRFTYHSKDGEEGYPGNLDVTVEYILGEDSLKWKATATTDKATPVNLTNHAYFNLTGSRENSVLDHVLKINAAEYLPVDKDLIPTSELKSVSGTAFDFQGPATIGENLKKMEGSFDHNLVLKQNTQGPAAICHDPASGRVMELSTNQPGLQFYLSSPFGNKFSAFCLEPQKFPDSPNQPDFPSSILHPGETYSHEITFRFPEPE